MKLEKKKLEGYFTKLNLQIVKKHMEGGKHHELSGNCTLNHTELPLHNN